MIRPAEVHVAVPCRRLLKFVPAHCAKRIALTGASFGAACSWFRWEADLRAGHALNTNCDGRRCYDAPPLDCILPSLLRLTYTPCISSSCGS